MQEWLETANAVTRLYPSMYMAKSNCHRLYKICDVAIMNLNSTLQRRLL